MDAGGTKFGKGQDYGTDIIRDFFNESALVTGKKGKRCVKSIEAFFSKFSHRF